MHAWLADVDLVQLAATLAILGIIAVTIIKSWRPVRAVVRFFDAMIGGEERDRDGHKLRPGILDRMTSLEQKVAEIHHEVHYNNGSSVKDSTARLEDTTRRQEDALRRIEDAQQQLLASTAEDARNLADHITDATARDERIDSLTRLVDKIRGVDEQD